MRTVVLAVLALAACSSPEGSAPQDAAPQDAGGEGPSLSDAARADVPSAVDAPAAADAGPAPLKILAQHAINAPGYDGAFSAAYSISSGWGYMAPQVVTVGQDVYTYTFYPCTLSNKQVYCVRLHENFKPLGPALSLAAHGAGVDMAYQPPSLFRAGTQLLLAHWAHATGAGRSMVQLLALDPAAASPAWKLRATHLTPAGSSYNYLGGALAGGAVLVAGWYSAPAGGARALRLIRSPAPHTAWQAATAAASYGSAWFNPLYTHVAARGGAGGEVDLLTSIGHMVPCPESGQGYTNYKNVVLYRGQPGGAFAAKWSNAASDVVSDPTYQGDPCYYRNMRFGLDLLYDAQLGETLALFKSSEITTYLPNKKLASNASYTQQLVLYRGAAVKVADLGPHFKGVFASSNQIGAVSMSKINGRYVFVAAGGGKVAVVSSKDLLTFSAPLAIPTPFGVGNSVKLNQPDKNGSSGLSTLHLWFSGDASGADGTNRFLRFFHVEVGVS